jgi:hypothetical protein
MSLFNIDWPFSRDIPINPKFTLCSLYYIIRKIILQNKFRINKNEGPQQRVNLTNSLHFLHLKLQTHYTIKQKWPWVWARTKRWSKSTSPIKMRAYCLPAKRGLKKNCWNQLINKTNPIFRDVCQIDQISWLSFVSFAWMFGYMWNSFKKKLPDTISSVNELWTASIFDSANINLARWKLA